MANNVVIRLSLSQACSMGLLHCPLCMGLAVLSALRFSAHALLAYQLNRQRSDLTNYRNDLIGLVMSGNRSGNNYCSDTTQAVAAR